MSLRFCLLMTCLALYCGLAPPISRAQLVAPLSPMPLPDALQQTKALDILTFDFNNYDYSVGGEELMPLRNGIHTITDQKTGKPLWRTIITCDTSLTLPNTIGTRDFRIICLTATRNNYEKTQAHFLYVFTVIDEAIALVLLEMHDEMTIEVIQHPKSPLQAPLVISYMPTTPGRAKQHYEGYNWDITSQKFIIVSKDDDGFEAY